MTQIQYKIRAYVWQGTAAALSLCATLFLLGKVAQFRLNDIGRATENRVGDLDNYRTLGLVSRYQLIQQRLLAQETGSDYLRETKLYLALGKTLSSELLEPPGFVDQFVLGVTNAFNRVIGVEPVKRYILNRLEQRKEQAYMLELTRNYEEAAKIFGTIAADTSGDERNYALLHRAFCESLSDKRQDALVHLREVIQAAQHVELKLTAELLERLMREIEVEVRRIAKLPNSEAKGEKLFYASLYQSSIDVFGRINAQARTQRGRFFLGRAYEETGQIRSAVDEYRSLISTDTKSLWSRLANRRLLVLGLAHEADPSYIDEAKLNQKLLGDKDVLFDRARDFSVIGNKNRVKKKRLALQAGHNLWSDLDAARIDALVASDYRSEAIPTKTSKPEKAEKLAIATPNIPKPERFIEKIATTDGSVLSGVILSENSERVIIKTVLGKVTIQKSKIASRSRVKKI